MSKMLSMLKIRHKNKGGIGPKIIFNKPLERVVLTLFLNTGGLIKLLTQNAD